MNRVTASLRHESMSSKYLENEVDMHVRGMYRCDFLAFKNVGFRRQPFVDLLEKCGAKSPRWVRLTHASYGDDSAFIKAVGLGVVTRMRERSLIGRVLDYIFIQTPQSMVFKVGNAKMYLLFVPQVVNQGRIHWTCEGGEG
jgi:hypothetical protein